MDPKDPQQNQPDQNHSHSGVRKNANFEFLNQAIQEGEEAQSVPVTDLEVTSASVSKRKRRWMLGCLGTSAISTAIGIGVLSQCGFGWRKVRTFVAGLIFDPFFDDVDSPKQKKPSGGNRYSVQTEKLKNEDEYREFVDSLKLQYISASEVIQPHRNILNGVKNELPPKKYWKRISETLKVADAIRAELGVPLKTINSAYRSPDYNAECRGASQSYHTRNMALDLVFACSSKEAAIAAKKLRSKGIFKGGIGVYSSFIHIDTRGKNANWGISV